MADRVIQAADLSYIERNLQALAGGINTVSQQVDTVDNRVGSVYAQLEDLTRKFEEFVARDATMKQLQLAESRVIKVKQQLQEEFGYYEVVRRHITGILQAADIRVIRKETIAQCTEELMLSAPRYWLAPCLVALAAWMNDNRDLAERALKEGMRRDDEKTALLFALICRRAGRFNSCLVWLERYFSMQDPFNMERKMIVVLDAFTTGLFGPDSKGLCAEKIKYWIDELSAVPGFAEEQKAQWQLVLKGKAAAVESGSYPYLAKHSPVWPELQAVLSWARTHQDIYQYLETIFHAIPENPARLSDKVDSLLDSLASNYDNEELPLRQELRRNELIIAEQGNLAQARTRFAAEERAFEARVNFAQHLTNVAMNPATFDAQKSSQKLAISLSKDWLSDAYEDLTAHSRSSVPLQIPLTIDDWTGTTRDGTNESELADSLNRHITDKLSAALATLKLNMLHWFALAGGAILALYGLISMSVLTVGIGLAGVIYYFVEYNKLKKAKEQVEEKFAGSRENANQLLRALLAEVVDYRREYGQKDEEYAQVADFLQQLSPQQFIAAGDIAVRQII